MARVRLWRFIRWYQRLRRDPLDAGYVDFRMPRGFALRTAWHWSSDIDAYRARPS